MITEEDSLTDSEIAMNAFLGEDVPASIVAEVGERAVRDLLAQYSAAFSLPDPAAGSPNPSNFPKTTTKPKQ